MHGRRFAGPPEGGPPHEFSLWYEKTPPQTISFNVYAANGSIEPPFFGSDVPPPVLALKL